MKHLNFLSKSSSQSCGHSSVTLASTVGSPSAHRRPAMLKLLSVLVLILTIGVGQMLGAEAVITFANQTSGSDSNTAYTSSNFVSSGIASSSTAFGTITCSATSRCYSGKPNMGLKCGGSSNAGSFTISFSELKNVSQIVLSRAAYSSDNNKQTTITVKNGSTTLGSAATGSDTDLNDMVIDNLNIASLTTLTVESGKYCYIKSITITYNPNYTLTYDGNGKTEGNVPTDASSPYAPSSTVTVLGNTGNLVRTGCTFAGWNTKADGTGTNYAADATFSISANTTLYAKWTATVTWKANNVIVKTDDIVVPAAGKTVTLPTDGEIGSNKCGDRIMGWTESENHKANTAPADLFTAAPTVQGSKTYYAVFADYAE